MTKFEQINQKTPISSCQQSSSAFVDLIILIAVIWASGFLVYPYVTLVVSKTLETIQLVQPVTSNSTVYVLLGLVVLTTSIMAMIVLTLLKSPKCGQPGCRGLKKAVEFDIYIETEAGDCGKNSSSSLLKYGMKNRLFELPRDYVNELEVELKKMAPANGRAVLVFRGGCGCPIVRVEVPGSKKNGRKMKK